VVRKNKGIFQNWKENFEKVMKEGLMPAGGIFFVEQSVFAATVSALNCRIKKFSPLYNYPIHLHTKIPDPNEKAKCISDIVSAHYHKIFIRGFPDKIFGQLIDPKDPKSRWLIKNLEKYGLIERGEIDLPRRETELLIRDFIKSFKVT
jgi:hypothetical protein